MNQGKKIAKLPRQKRLGVMPSLPKKKASGPIA